jgi:PTH1 family peptidyl-tRNA hydrolase
LKAIVGLGNPGDEYTDTRHNVGFQVVDELARRWRARLKSWKSIADVALVKDHDVLLVKPRTFMNSSGEAVQRVAAFHKLDLQDVLIVVDEAQLPLGRLRLRGSGSDGGHNGLKSVIQHIGAGFPRLRMGVGRGDPRWNLADHVLSTFDRTEREVVAQSVSRAADAVEVFVNEGLLTSMNRFNAAEAPAKQSEPESEA